MSGTGRVADPGAKATVVVVDDHLLVADGFAAAIDREPDIGVIGVAGTSAEGLELVGRLRPDVVLLDQRLPDGLGTDVLPLMVAAAPSVRVLLVTADTSDGVMVKAIQAGCTGFLRKGVRSPELIAAVRAAVAGEAVIDVEDLRRLLPRLRGGHHLGADLTARERSILQLLADGHSTAAIADRLTIAHATARNHIQAVLVKLHAHSRLEAVAVAMRENLVREP